MIRLVPFLVCLVTIVLSASEAGPPSISGTVSNIDGTAVQGATIEARNRQTRAAYSVQSSSDGAYVFPQLSPGDYVIAVKKQGMLTYSHAFVSVTTKSAIREDVTLSPNPDPTAVDLSENSMPVPVVRRPGKDFYSDAGELELAPLSVTVNDRLIELPKELVKGRVIWIYVPGKGRYFLSLQKHLELRLELAGQVEGDSLDFQLGNDIFHILSEDRIAPGSSAYNLYAGHQPDWKPAVESAGALAGSMDSPASITK